METPSQSAFTTPSDRPNAADGAVIFLREADGAPGDGFLPLFHHQSITLRELAEEYNISSVLECDARGAVQPRAVAFDSPSDVLHSGRHYIARRDAKDGDGANRVTFRGKILVKEYDLENHTTPSGVGRAANQGHHQQQQRRGFQPGTPYIGRRPDSDVGNDVDDGEEEGGKDGTDRRNPSTKRPRNGDEENGKATVLQVPYQAGSSSLLTAAAASQPLGDRTNQLNLSTGSLKGAGTTTATDTTTARDGAEARATGDEDEEDDDDAGPPLRFLPFLADVHGSGTEAMLRLEDLAALCTDVDAVVARHEQRHSEAEDMFESARRVLFAVNK